MDYYDSSSYMPDLLVLQSICFYLSLHTGRLCVRMFLEHCISFFLDGQSVSDIILENGFAELSGKKINLEEG